MMWDIELIVGGRVVDRCRDLGVPHFEEARLARDEKGNVVEVRWLDVGGNRLYFGPGTSLTTIARSVEPDGAVVTSERTWGSIAVVSGGRRRRILLRGTPEKFEIIKHSWGISTEIRVDSSYGGAKEKVYVLSTGADALVLDLPPIDFGG